jgi:hypothetical protein
MLRARSMARCRRNRIGDWFGGCRHGQDGRGHEGDDDRGG